MKKQLLLYAMCGIIAPQLWISEYLLCRYMELYSGKLCEWNLFNSIAIYFYPSVLILLGAPYPPNFWEDILLVASFALNSTIYVVLGLLGILLFRLGKWFFLFVKNRMG